jgi:hypothetical protein
MALDPQEMEEGQPLTFSDPSGMQITLHVMNIPIYDKAVSVWGTYSIDFFRFRHIFLTRKSTFLRYQIIPLVSSEN